MRDALDDSLKRGEMAKSVNSKPDGLRLSDKIPIWHQNVRLMGGKKNTKGREEWHFWRERFLWNEKKKTRIKILTRTKITK